VRAVAKKSEFRRLGNAHWPEHRSHRFGGRTCFRKSRSQARAFAVAGVMRLDILQILRDGIDQAIAQGESIESFRKTVRSQLLAKGWWGNIEVTDPDTGELRTTKFNDRRLQLIYDVNLRQSYAAGRWSRIERLKQRFPFVMYRTMRDERVRKSHQEWDGLALPVESDFWRTHYPPNGWNCRCTAFGIDEAGIAKLQRAGLPVKRKEPAVQWRVWHNPTREGDVAFVPVPRGIDPGFAYNPGQSRDAAFFDVAMQKAQRTLPREAAVAITQALNEAPVLLAEKLEAFGQWVDANLQAFAAVDHSRPQETQVPRTAQYIGAIHPWAWDGIKRAGIELLSPVLAVHSEDVKHALVDKNKKQLLPLTLYKRLPELLRQVTAVWLDETQARPALLYVVDVAQPDGRIAKLVFQLDAVRKTDEPQGSPRANWLRTVGLMDADVVGSTGARLIWGTP
jgi:SPP1 gp7 family putative phage head morphogenesis protein